MAKKATALIKIEQARRALEQARTIEDHLNVADAASMIEGAMKRRGVGVETMNEAASIKLQAERMVGRMLTEAAEQGKRSKGGRPPKTGNGGQLVLDTLDDLGIKKNDSSKWQKMARLSDEDFDELFQECQHNSDELTQALILRIVRQRESGPKPIENLDEPHEWIMTDEWVHVVKKAMGSIELDPASSTEANAIIQADRFFAAADGDSTFVKDWIAKSVWLFPPRTMPMIARFISKLIHELESRHVGQAILLVNAQIDTEWFREAASHASAFAIPHGQLEFVMDKGDSIRDPVFGQVFLYYGNRLASFRKQFESKDCQIWVKPT